MLTLRSLAVALDSFRSQQGGQGSEKADTRTFNFFCLHVVHARAVLSPSRGRLGARTPDMVFKDYPRWSLKSSGIFMR